MQHSAILNIDLNDATSLTAFLALVLGVINIFITVFLQRSRNNHERQLEVLRVKIQQTSRTTEVLENSRRQSLLAIQALKDCCGALIRVYDKDDAIYNKIIHKFKIALDAFVENDQRCHMDISHLQEYVDLANLARALWCDINVYFIELESQKHEPDKPLEEHLQTLLARIANTQKVMTNESINH